MEEQNQYKSMYWIECTVVKTLTQLYIAPTNMSFRRVANNILLDDRSHKLLVRELLF